MGEAELATSRFGLGVEERTLLFLHATGLNASAYRPLLEGLEHPGTVLAPSLRGHGATRLPADPAALRDWWPLAEDVRAGFSSAARPLVMAGHSAGAVTALLAAKSLKPARLLMIEPVVLPRLFVHLARSPLRRVTTDRIGIAKAAARRRPGFASREEASGSYRGKRFFAGWDERALAGYLDEGLAPDDEGGVRLTCDPAFEAAMFRAQAHGFWPHLREVVRSGTEVFILASSRHSVMKDRARTRARRYGAEVTIMEGGHMLPVEKPVEVADWMRDRTRV
jgi:pimeloyl-ACP methyl ester carboxylesterase